jgi:hypothetical protein
MPTPQYGSLAPPLIGQGQPAPSWSRSHTAREPRLVTPALRMAVST